MFITLGQGGVDFEPKKGGGRTAIEVFPVRVYPKRGAETGETRLRGWEVWEVVRGKVVAGVGLVGDFELDPAVLGGVVEFHGVASGGKFLPLLAHRFTLDDGFLQVPGRRSRYADG